MSGHRKSSRNSARLMPIGELAGLDDRDIHKRKFKSPPVKVDIRKGRIYPKRSIPEALFIDVAKSLGYNVRRTGSGIHIQLETNANVQKVLHRLTMEINESLDRSENRL